MKWTAALLALLLLSIAGVLIGRGGRLEEAFLLQDRTYVDIAVASHLNADRTYGGEPGQPIAATRDTLWRSLLALSGARRAVTPLLALVWSTLSAGLLLVLVMLWRSGIPGPDWRRGLAGLLLLCAAPLVPQSLDGTSDVLAACLVLGAAMMQVRGFATGAAPLYLETAVLLGLATWLRVDCALWWFVFVAQAGLASLGRGLGTMGRLTLLLRALNGMLLIAILVAPLVAWNMRVVGVPWPREWDTLAFAPQEAASWTRMLLAGLSQWPAALDQLHASGPLHPLALRAIFWLGLLSLMRRVLRRELDGGQLLPVVAYALLPFLHALSTPWLGREGGRLLFVSASALWLPALVEGCWCASRILTRTLRKAGLREDGWLTHTRAAWLIASACVLLGLRDVGGRLLEQSHRLRAMSAARQEVLAALQEMKPKPRRIATDRPGWLVACGGFPVVDVTGQLTPSMLALMDEQGRVDASQLGAYLASRGADAVLLWDAGFDSLRAPHTAIRLEAGGDAPAYLSRLTRRGVP